ANGCGALAVPADPYNRPDQPNGANNNDSSAYVALQQDGCFTTATAGQAASQVGSSAGCLDRAAPRARVAKKRPALLSGTRSDRGCGAAGRGKVRSVWVAIARRAA